MLKKIRGSIFDWKYYNYNIMHKSQFIQIYILYFTGPTVKALTIYITALGMRMMLIKFRTEVIMAMPQ